MGMTIDDCIGHLDGILTEAAEFTNSVCYVTEDDAETLQLAIDTMHKYQKIVPALVNYDLLNPIADVKTIDGEGIYINLSDLQDYIHKVVDEAKS